MTKKTPPGFKSFWDSVDEDLAHIPIAAETEHIPMRSTEKYDLYGVRITSVGPYRLFGYLSVPKTDEIHPAIYYVPKNASVHEIIPQGTAIAVREHYVTFSLACRGMRNSDKPYAAMYPGQLTDGLESAESYVYRGIVADTIRGLEYIITRPEIDKDRITAWGNDNALLLAARRKQITHVVTQPAYLFDTIKNSATTTSYPLAEFSDYLRLHPERTSQVAEILEMYNLRWHAPYIKAKTLVRASEREGIYSPSKLAEMNEMIAGEVTIHESERSSFKDGLFAEKWLTRQMLGPTATPIVPEHWQDFV